MYKDYLKKNFLVKILKESVGDWRYPYILLSWWFAKLLVPRRKVSVNGINFTLSCTNWITHFRWYLFKTKEPETISFIDNYVQDDDIFFDIGANIGVFTIYATKKHKNLISYSFEPEASNLATLKENIVKNKLMDRTIIYGVGIGDTVGLSFLHLPDLTPGAALHSEDKNKLEKSVEGDFPILWKEGIYTVTLDHFCDQINIIPNVIKIDTDGNEGKILKGALNTLKNQKLKAIILEMPEEQNDLCSKILLDSGFKIEGHENINSRNQIWLKNI